MMRRAEAATQVLEPPSESCRRWQCIETVVLLLIFAALNASPPPGVGESHYLAKAKHYWNPGWCPGDLFLESGDAHLTFYWVFGWITRFVSLANAAWIGRFVVWSLLAYGWTRLSWAIIAVPAAAILSGVVFAVLQAHANLAGEWVIGGVEAKGFAYVFVLFALEAVVMARWPQSLLWAGCATAFHVLVGGWLTILIACSWLFCAGSRGSFRWLSLAALAAFAIGLFGLVPALLLNRGVPEDIVREANRIYVFERLRHHLDFNFFGLEHLLRFSFQLAAWLLLVRLVGNTPRTWRLRLVIFGALGIAFVGIGTQEVVSWISEINGLSATEYQSRVAGLLKYYWFRMADSLLPVGAALAAAQYLTAALKRNPARTPLLLAAVGVSIAAAATFSEYRFPRYFLPGAILQPLPKDGLVAWIPGRTRNGDEIPTRPVPAEQWYREWRKVCAWIERNAPRDAKFITPRRQQTFKWYAQRAEVANWKDVPQDARSLVQWIRTIEAIYDRAGHGAGDVETMNDYELAGLARRYGASYIIIDCTCSKRPTSLRRCYPPDTTPAPIFEVYEVGKR